MYLTEELLENTSLNIYFDSAMKHFRIQTQDQSRRKQHSALSDGIQYKWHNCLSTVYIIIVRGIFGK